MQGVDQFPVILQIKTTHFTLDNKQMVKAEEQAVSASLLCEILSSYHGSQEELAAFSKF